MKIKYWQRLGLKRDPFPAHLAAGPYLTSHWQPYLNFLLDTAQYRKHLLLIIGPAGIGKTTLFKKISQQLQSKVNLLQLEAHTTVCAEYLAKLFATEFQIFSTNPNEDVYVTVERQLRALQATGQQYLLIIDNAEKLPLTTQQFCLHIVNYQVLTQTCLQVVLFGQPNLVNQFEKIIQQQADLSQDYIIKTLSLEPFSFEEVAQYLQASLQNAEADGQLALFTQSAIQQIYEQSGGLPVKISACAKLVLQNKVKLTSPNNIVKRYKWLLGIGSIIIMVLALTSFWWHGLKLASIPTVTVTATSVSPVSSVNSAINLAASAAPGSYIVINGKITTSTAAPSVAKASIGPRQLALVKDSSAADRNSVRAHQKMVINGKIRDVSSINNETAKSMVEQPALFAATTVIPFSSRLVSVRGSSAADRNSVKMHEKMMINGQLSKLPSVITKVSKHSVEKPDSIASTALIISSGMTTVAPSIRVKAKENNLNKTEQQLLKVPKHTITLQLFLTKDMDSVQAFINKYKLTGMASVYRLAYQGQLAYVVILGRFSSKKSALKNIATLDLSLQKLKPWPRTFADVHADILKTKN